MSGSFKDRLVCEVRFPDAWLLLGNILHFAYCGLVENPTTELLKMIFCCSPSIVNQGWVMFSVGFFLREGEQKAQTGPSSPVPRLRGIGLRRGLCSEKKPGVSQNSGPIPPSGWCPFGFPFNPSKRGMWLKIKQQGQTAGFGPCFHFPG